VTVIMILAAGGYTSGLLSEVSEGSRSEGISKLS